MKRSRPAQWWELEDLRFDGDRLTLAGVALDQVARKRGTPLYAYSADRIRQNLRRLSSALRRRRVRHRIFYALKANRFRPLLGVIRDTGMCGVDVCSPGELLLARRAGFPEEAISYTGTSASDDDLAVIRRFPRIAVNCDSLSMLRRIGRLQPGRPVGLRVNPEIGFGWHGKRLLRYSGGRPSKFGIYRQQFAEALEVAASHRLRVEGIHFHCGCGYLGGQLPLFGRVLELGAWFAEQVPRLRYINIGGGLGVPLVRSDRPLDLEAWSSLIASRLGQLRAQVWIEPGDYIVKDAGVLLLQVTLMETKAGIVFCGVNGGCNLHPEPAYYGLPLHPVPCRRPAAGRLTRVTIAGNINEALDLFGEDVLLPPLREGEILALLNAGGYGSAMSSNHCLRGEFREILLGRNRAGASRDARIHV